MALITAEEYNINQLLGKTVFQVPIYQRTYAWEKDQWDDLYEDLVGLNENDTHFIGAFVLVKDSEKQSKDVEFYRIVDGQQRLATLFIWLSAIRDVAKEEGDKFIPSHIEKNLLFIDELTEQGIKTHSKLQLGDLDEDAFNKVLKMREKTYNHSIFDCYNYFKERTTSEHYWMIIEKISVVCIYANDYFNAFRLFETMNDRGLELSAADLIKNYILMNVSNKKEIFEEVSAEWNEMYEKVRDFEPVKFIRRYFLSTYKGVISENKLYEALKNKIDNKKPEEILTFVKNLNKTASTNEKIFTRNFDSYEIDNRLELLEMVEVLPAYTLLLKIMPFYENNLIEEKEVLEIMHYIENLHLRYGICELHTGKLDAIYNEICMNIDKIDPNNISDYVKEIFTREITKNAPDETFRSSFTKKKFKSSQKRTKYILWKLSDPTDETRMNIQKIHTEHIMPQRLSNHWLTYIKENESLNENQIVARKKDNIDLIGNLTIIKGEWNQKMSNRSFYVKKRSYLDSEFNINKELANNYNKWSFNAIKRRSEELAENALKIWKWNYDIGKAFDVKYWITSIKQREEISVKDALNELLGSNIYVFADNTSGKDMIKPGDHICFYESEKGVIANAIVKSYPKREPNLLKTHFKDYPWVFKVKDVKMYYETPITLDKEILSKLDYYETKNQINLGWLVRSTKTISHNDFNILTNITKNSKTKNGSNLKN